MEPIQLKPWAVVLVSPFRGKVSVCHRADTFEEAADLATFAEMARQDQDSPPLARYEVDIWHASELYRYRNQVVA